MEYRPDRPHKTADEMHPLEAQAIRLAILLIERAGGRVEITQAELDDAADRKPVLKTYLDPFIPAFVYETESQEESEQARARMDDEEFSSEPQEADYDSGYGGRRREDTVPDGGDEATTRTRAGGVGDGNRKEDG